MERYLTLAMIQNRMHTAIIADADTNVTDEEANTSFYSYVKVSKQSHTDEDGNTVEYTDTEPPPLLGKTVGAVLTWTPRRARWRMRQSSMTIR